MRILIRAPRSRQRRYIADLAERLRRSVDAQVAFALVDAAPPPPGVEPLLALERILYRRHRSGGVDLERLDALPLDAAPDLVIDLVGEDKTAIGGRTLRPLFDGAAGEDALIGALLHGRVPLLAIALDDGEIVGEAFASLEGASGLSGAMEAVFSRLSELVAAFALDGRVRRLSVGGGPAFPGASTPAPRLSRAIRYGAKAMARQAATAIYRLCTFAPHWRIGWRFNEGPDVFDRLSLDGPAWRVLPDPGTNFYADPFPVRWRGQEALFFEDLDHRVGKGTISVVVFGPDGPAGAARPVLEEPWHLSYPFIFEHEDQLWMVPESSTNNDVALYRCVEFPLRWERRATLLTGVEAADATLFPRDGLWWMMATTRPHAGGYSDTLSVYYSQALQGPWQAHPGNPLLIDNRCARPAGYVFERDGRWFRPAQDCSASYGGALALAEITRLDREGFAQTVRKVISPGPAWPGRKLHTWNRSGRLEVIDGAAINPRFAPLRPWSLRAQAPRS